MDNKDTTHCKTISSARKQGLDNIKRDLLYNYNVRFTGTKKTKKGHSGWCVRQC